MDDEEHSENSRLQITSLRPVCRPFFAISFLVGRRSVKFHSRSSPLFLVLSPEPVEEAGDFLTALCRVTAPLSWAFEAGLAVPMVRFGDGSTAEVER